MREWKNRVKLAPYDVIPKSPKVVKVNLDVEFKGEKIRTWAYGIKTQFIKYPKKAWEKYARGYPYDFSCIDHPDHTPEGYKKFADKVYKACKKTGVVVCGGDRRPKLGDIVWCTRKKRWYQCDVA